MFDVRRFFIGSPARRDEFHNCDFSELCDKGKYVDDRLLGWLDMDVEAFISVISRASFEGEVGLGFSLS